MGENRDRSADSRVSLDEDGLGGPVPVESIGGRAEFITFSLDGSTGWNPASWLSSLRSGRAGASLHPARSTSAKENRCTHSVSNPDIPMSKPPALRQCTIRWSGANFIRPPSGLVGPFPFPFLCLHLTRFPLG